MHIGPCYPSRSRRGGGLCEVAPVARLVILDGLTEVPRYSSDLGAHAEGGGQAQALYGVRIDGVLHLLTSFHPWGEL